jgi:phage terminase small subunit
VKLNPRQHLFVHEYLVDPNATHAAIKAGYSKKTAYSQGQRLLKHVEVAAQIATARKKREARTEITQARVLEELAIIAFSDLRNHVDINEDTGAIRAKAFDEMPGNSSRALEMIKEDRMIREDSKGEDSIINEKVTFKLHSKTAALDMVMKHLGMYEKDNSQVFPKDITFRFVYVEPEKKQG